MTSSNDVVLVGGKGLDWTTLRWDSVHMPYMMLETAEQDDQGIQFLASSTPLDPALTILRLHIFGKGGDLLLRCDEGRVFWRFVGERSMYKRLGLQGVGFPGVLQTGEQEKSLLWGKYDNEEPQDVKRGYRYEARMGRVNFDYPSREHKDWERVEIHAYPVTANGEVVAYWTHSLAEHKPQETQ